MASCSTTSGLDKLGAVRVSSVDRNRLGTEWAGFSGPCWKRDLIEKHEVFHPETRGIGVTSVDPGGGGMDVASCGTNRLDHQADREAGIDDVIDHQNLLPGDQLRKAPSKFEGRSAFDHQTLRVDEWELHREARALRTDESAYCRTTHDRGLRQKVHAGLAQQGSETLGSTRIDVDQILGDPPGSMVTGGVDEMVFEQQRPALAQHGARLGLCAFFEHVHSPVPRALPDDAHTPLSEGVQRTGCSRTSSEEPLRSTLFSAADHTDQEQNDGDDEQDVDEITDRDPTHHSEQPEDDQDDGNGKEHEWTP